MIKLTMRWPQRLADRIGGWPTKRVTWGLVLAFSSWVLLDVFVFRVSGGVASSSYDAMVRARMLVAAPDPRIVIVDIDEASLARMGKEFGRWPWPRDTLATVLDYLERQQPAAVVWDIVFSDPDRLSPGGDAAFNLSAARSLHSHFPVVRLPAANDSLSQLTRRNLPGLWVGGVGATTDMAGAGVALVAPALPAVAAGRLGYNNGYVDGDGVLRRYRYAEPLDARGTIRSIALSVLTAMNPGAADDLLDRVARAGGLRDELIAWRRHANAYPRLSFAELFEQADGGKPGTPQFDFTGKVIIIGSTAPSLHDVHPTPLSPVQAGVDSLATAIDNALNQRYLAELPRWLQALVAILLCVGLGFWVQIKSVASLAPALLALPAALLGISYLSLNGLPFFLDLHLAAGLALVFLAVLRVWTTLRRNHWCAPPPARGEQLVLWPWRRARPWLDAPVDRLIDLVERHVPSCRVVVCDASISWPATLRWPELACFAAIVGPRADLLAARPVLERAMLRLARQSGEFVELGGNLNRENLATAVFTAWSKLQKTDKREARKEMP